MCDALSPDLCTRMPVYLTHSAARRAHRQCARVLPYLRHSAARGAHGQCARVLPYLRHSATRGAHGQCAQVIPWERRRSPSTDQCGAVHTGQDPLLSSHSPVRACSRCFQCFTWETKQPPRIAVLHMKMYIFQVMFLSLL